MRGWMAEWYVVATDKWQLVVLSPIVCWSMPYTIHMYVTCSAAANLKTRALPVGWLDPYAVHNTCYVVCYMCCPNPILCRCLLMLCIFQVSVHISQPGLSLSEPSCFLFCSLGPFFRYLPLAFRLHSMIILSPKKPAHHMSNKMWPLREAEHNAVPILILQSQEIHALYMSK